MTKQTRQTERAVAGGREPGLLVSLVGVGAHRALGALRTALHSDPARPPVVVGQPWQDGVAPNFRTSLALADEAGADPFVPRGRHTSEAMLLLALQVHHYESVRHFLASGRTVLEEGGVHAAAVHSGLTHHPDDLDAAHRLARRFLETAALWRPLPDLVVFAGPAATARVSPTGKGAAARARHATRDRDRKATALFARLAADDPDRCRTLVLAERKERADGSVPRISRRAGDDAIVADALDAAQTRELGEWLARVRADRPRAVARAGGARGGATATAATATAAAVGTVRAASRATVGRAAAGKAPAGKASAGKASAGKASAAGGAAGTRAASA